MKILLLSMKKKCIQKKTSENKNLNRIEKCNEIMKVMNEDNKLKINYGSYNKIDIIEKIIFLTTISFFINFKLQDGLDTMNFILAERISGQMKVDKKFICRFLKRNGYSFKKTNNISKKNLSDAKSTKKINKYFIDLYTYIHEKKKQNPNTVIKIVVEDESNFSSEIKTNKSWSPKNKSTYYFDCDKKISFTLVISVSSEKIFVVNIIPKVTCINENGEKNAIKGLNTKLL